MITSCPTHVVEAVMHPIFNCCAKNATEVNLTVVTAKFITAKWVTIVAMTKPQKVNLKNHAGRLPPLQPILKQPPQANVLALLKREHVAVT
jgi:hypothetical protein